MADAASVSAETRSRSLSTRQLDMRWIATGSVLADAMQELSDTRWYAVFKLPRSADWQVAILLMASGAILADAM